MNDDDDVDADDDDIDQIEMQASVICHKVKIVRVQFDLNSNRMTRILMTEKDIKSKYTEQQLRMDNIFQLLVLAYLSDDYNHLVRIRTQLHTSPMYVVSVNFMPMWRDRFWRNFSLQFYIILWRFLFPFPWPHYILS